MGYFKIDNNKCLHYNDHIYDKRNEIDYFNEDEYIPQNQRITVMGAVLRLVDQKTFVTTVAVVNKFGKYITHKDFFDLIPPKKHLKQGEIPRPEDIENQ